MEKGLCGMAAGEVSTADRRLARLRVVDAPLNGDDAADQVFFEGLRDVYDTSPLAEEALFVQHGTTSVLLHSIAVAHLACRMARHLGWTDHLEELERAALLHDLFLYDWHVPGPGQQWHAFLHPVRALQNACAAYPDLTEREANAILRHMFPLMPVPPRHREGWVLTLADKWCASYETYARAGMAYPNLQALCARYAPDVVLSLPGVSGDPARLDEPAAPRVAPLRRLRALLGASADGRC